MRKRRILTRFTLLLSLIPLFTLLQPVAAATNVTACVYAGGGGLQDALASGGTITFGCSGTIIVPDISITTSIILDGSGQNVILSGNNTNRIFDILNGGNLTLRNITLSDGKATQDGLTYRIGGAIYNQWTGTLHIINSIITHNEAEIGGGIHISPNSVTTTIENTTFSENTALGGAGIWNGGAGGVLGDSSLTIRNSYFINNHVIDTGALAIGGGALNNRLGRTLIENSVFSGNTVSGNVALPYSVSGGAIVNSSIMTISGSTISGNSVINTTPANSDGGGILNEGASLTVLDSIVTNNSASNGGGILNRNSSTLQIENSTISENTSVIGGGIRSGIPFYYGTNAGKASTITNSTIVNNTATDLGSGIYNTDLNGGTLSVNNSILASNTDDNCGGNIIDGGFNLSTDSTCPVGFVVNTPAQINLGGLEDNGGATQTYALLAGSSAIDAGNCVNGNDQRGSGYGRPLDFPALVNAGNGCDIGAFEVQNVPLASDQNTSPTRNYFTMRRVMLTWNLNTTAIGYEVEVATNSTFTGTLSYATSLPPNKLSTLTSVLPNGIYYWHVRAKLSETPSGTWSSFESFRVDAP